MSYSGHVAPTTVARISPTGYYCASADTSGTGKLINYLVRDRMADYFIVRVWDLVGEDQILKSEVKVIAGKL